MLLALSATTPMLLSVSVPVAPPFMLSVVPSLRSTVVPLSPSNLSGLKAWAAVWLMALFTLVTVLPFTVIGVLFSVLPPAVTLVNVGLATVLTV